MANRNAVVNIAGTFQETPSGDTLQASAIQATGLSGLSTGRFVGVTTVGSPTSGTFVVGDWVIDQSGNMYVCTVAGTQGTWISPTDTRNLLTTGEETFARDTVSSVLTSVSSQAMRMTYFTARKTETTTQVKVYTGTTAAAATPTLCRIGLYTIAATGDGTLVASTTNDTTLFAASNTAYTRSWSSSYAKIAGQRYALAILVVTAAAAPSITGILAGTAPTVENSIVPRLSSALTSQSDLPSTFTSGSLTTNTSRYYAAILP